MSDTHKLLMALIDALGFEVDTTYHDATTRREFPVTDHGGYLIPYSPKDGIPIIETQYTLTKKVQSPEVQATKAKVDKTYGENKDGSR